MELTMFGEGKNPLYLHVHGSGIQFSVFLKILALRYVLGNWGRG